jgi:hypothetical protein
MKKFAITLVAIFFLTNAFSQTENFSKISIIEKKAGIENRNENIFSESIIVLKKNERYFLKALQFENYESQFDTSRVKLKLNDYKIKSLNCSGEDISSQSLMQNLVIDEVTNYLLNSFFKTKTKLF